MPLDSVRSLLSRRRGEIRDRFEQGASGGEIGAALSDMVDDAIGQLYNIGLSALSAEDQAKVREHLSLIPLGGYGRRDLAPFSDVDLLLLHDGEAAEVLFPFTKELVRNIWDVGLSLGQNFTTLKDLLQLTREEALSATALLEARFLIGSESLFQDAEHAFARAMKRGGAARLYGDALHAVREEQQKHGSTTYLLEPNVKRTAGGLRDLHLMRWLGKAKYGTADFSRLEAMGVLGEGDARALNESREFLLLLRAELHFHAGKPNDQLSRSEQWRIAKRRGYEDTPSLLAVEFFMRDYYFRTTSVVEVLGRFLERTRPTSYARGVHQLLLTRRIGPGMKAGPRELLLTDAARERYTSNLERTLELFGVSTAYGVDLDQATLESLRRHYGGSNRFEVPAPAPVPFEEESAWPAPSPEAVRRFLDLLARPAGLAQALRRMHQAGVLERLIPEFEHARCLLQFNEYHKYTVDEHTFVMVQEVEKLANRDDLAGRVFRRVARRDLLLLAILLHDLGKGFTEDHSEVGKRLAELTARRFRLLPSESSMLVFLVHQHLLLSNLAYRRDTSDPAVWVQLARMVGTIEILRMLYVLTVVDNIAVGPGTFTQWKEDLLAHLFTRARNILGDDDFATDVEEKIRPIRDKLLLEHGDDPRTREFIENLPAGYLTETSREEVVAHLLQWRVLAEGDVATLTNYQPKTNTVVYTILAHERLTSGIFHKICGALAAHHLAVLSARIHTMADGTVVDRFEVIDTHHTGPPAPERCKLVSKTVRRVLTGELEVADVLWSSRPSVFAPKRTDLGRDETEVVIDNASSNSCSVIEVFTTDRHRLLFHLAQRIYRLGLSVQYAKITTYAHQVVDVFYVQGENGEKILAEDAIHSIREQLLHDVRQIAKEPH